MLSVINELKQANPEAPLEVWFICDKGYAKQAAALLRHAIVPIEFKAIFAGKLRRYHGQTWFQRLTDVATIFYNVRDIALLSMGFVQSFYMLLRVRPDVVFTKGGFVCVPVGLAAAALGIPLVIHDSDTIPGLTNRFLARFASAIATGASLDNYNYPAARSHYVGIPINPIFSPITDTKRAEYKRELGYDPDKPLILITGGGTGSVLVNKAVADYAPRLVAKAQIVHLTGTGKAEQVEHSVDQQLSGVSRRDYHVIPFLDKQMPATILAADVVVTRAGATTLLELAAAGAACVIVPNPYLTEGHQLKNAKVYTERQAATVIDERGLLEQPALLADAIEQLIDDAGLRQTYRKTIVSLAKPDAARDVARLIRRASSGYES